MIINDVEITLREAIVSLIIVAIMIILGSLIVRPIVKGAEEKSRMMDTANVITEADLFQHAYKTELPNIIHYGIVSTVDPIKDELLDGEYMKIEREYQTYTRKTRLVSYSCGKDGKDTCWRTEEYWEWDTTGWEDRSSTTLRYHGMEFPLDKFMNMGTTWVDTVDNGYHRRIKLHVTNTTHEGTIHSNYLERERYTLHRGQTPQGMIDKAHRDINSGKIFFWIMWTFLTGGAVVGYVALENEYLN